MPRVVLVVYPVIALYGQEVFMQAQVEQAAAVRSQLEVAQEREAQKLAAKEKKIKERIAAKYSHAHPETLQWDAAAQKYSVEITCTVSGERGRRVFTSDLHQVTMSVAEAEKAKKAAKSAKKAQVKEALELIKAGKVS